MFGDLTLKKNDATSWTFSKLSTAGDTSVFLAAGSDQVNKVELVVKNVLGGAGPVAGSRIRRVLLSMRKTAYDSATAKTHTYTVNMTLQGLVDGTQVTATHVNDMIAALREFATQSTAANITKVLNGEL